MKTEETRTRRILDVHMHMANILGREVKEPFFSPPVNCNETISQSTRRHA